MVVGGAVRIVVVGVLAAVGIVLDEVAGIVVVGIVAEVRMVVVGIIVVVE